MNQIRLLKRQEVEERVGLRCSTIYLKIKQGKFPPPVKQGGASRWREDELDDYIENLPRKL